MPILERFDPPANIDDFAPDESQLRERFRSEWSKRVTCWFETAIVGDAWAAENDHPRPNMFNPLGKNIPAQPDATVAWTAFPKRLKDRFETPPPPEPPQPIEEIRRFADEGPSIPWGPSGSRGWQDEYCEWAVDRNTDNKIVRITFTCENPEYWETLWFVSPEKVLALYRKYLRTDAVQLEDLFARDQQNRPIIDRETGRPAYARRNRWNRNLFNGGQNGVMHLISAPNNLFAEIYLAGGASTLRKNDADAAITDKDLLIDCGRYGEAGRHSDPNIGFAVNDNVRRHNASISLANPVGLYIVGLTLDPGDFRLPSGAPSDVSGLDFWTVVRGTKDMTLRAVYEVPEEFGFVVGDIKINGEEIRFGSQLAEHIQVKLSAILGPGPAFPAVHCVKDSITRLPRAFGMFDPDGQLQTRRFLRGTITRKVLLACEDTPSNASIEIEGSGVSLDITDRFQTTDGVMVFIADVHIASDAPVGFRNIALRVDGNPSPAVPCLLEVTDWLPSSPAPLDLNRIAEVGTRLHRLMSLPRGDSGM